jgi:hypothetical protein
MTRQEALDKVRKLLRLGESSNEHEAAAAVAMATRLMEKFAIEQAMLDVQVEDAEEQRAWEQPLVSKEGWGPRGGFSSGGGALWVRRLARVLCHSQGVYYFLEGTAIKLVGTATRVQTVRYLHTYCVSEIQRLAKRHAGNGREWVKGYRNGCVDAIAEAIKREKEAERAAAHATYGDNVSKALMVIDNALTLATQHAHKTIPGLRAMRSSARAGDHGARDTGRREGASIYPGNGAGKSRVGPGSKRIGG